MPTDCERLEGGLVGLLVGDAPGVPYEFEKIPAFAEIEFEPPPGHWRAWPGTPPGTWSDDGAQALCLLASLLETDRLDPEDLAARLLRSHTKGYLWVDDRPYDIGNITAQALEAFRDGAPALSAGPTGERDNGNGSLMRTLPLALWHRGSDAELAADAQTQSRITHGHLRSQVCCALYCLWARRTREGVTDPWSAAVKTLRDIYGLDSSARQDLEEFVRPDQPPGGQGSGYVVDCLHSARFAVAAGPYEMVVKTAVSLGDDTDTTACVAGGIAGIRDGVEAIPERWRRKLRGRELYAPLLEGLLRRSA
jgi:ADP-ribosylglycohydrolase